MFKSKNKYKSYVLMINDNQNNLKTIDIDLKQDQNDKYEFDIKYFYVHDTLAGDCNIHEMNIFAENITRNLQIPGKYLEYIKNEKEKYDILLKIMMPSIFPIAMKNK